MPAGRILEGLRMLVVEDEYFLADDLKRLLLTNGAETVRLSGNQADAVVCVSSEPFGFALVDINLRGSLCFPVADELARRGVPFGFVTGYDRQDLPPRFKHAPHWQKPIDPRQLARDIDRLRREVN